MLLYLVLAAIVLYYGQHLIREYLENRQQARIRDARERALLSLAPLTHDVEAK